MHALKFKYFAYGNLSFLEVINHLKSNYNMITPTVLKDNSDCMKYTYDSNQPLEMVNDQIETAVDFNAAVRVPFAPEQVVTTAYDLILSTGCLLTPANAGT